MVHLTPETIAKLEKMLNEGHRLEIAIERGKTAIVLVKRKLIEKS